VKVAYFSPLPPDTSGIADYSALLLPSLGRLVEVEAVRPGRTRPVADADIAVYHVGNNPDAHGWIVDALRRRPGVVVLHEFVLHHLIAGLTIGRKDAHAYLAAMEREAGVPGRLLGWGVIEGRVPPLWEVRPQEFPLAGEILDRATGVIAHSRYVETLAREHGYDGPLWRIPHPAWPAAAVVPATVSGSPLIGCFGHQNESKRIEQLVRAFAAFRTRHPGARLLLVGPESPGFHLDERLRRLGVEGDGVVREPYVEEDRLWSLIAACDACVLLRSPTMGETSGSAIRTLGLGKPLVVSDVGWFAELPDDVALKVPPGGDGEVAAIEAALERLTEPGVAAAMGEAARVTIERDHDVDRVAELYVAALEEVAGSEAVDRAVLHEVAQSAADVGLEPDALAPALQDLVRANGRPATVRATGRTAALVGRAPMWLWLCALYGVAGIVHLALALRIHSPWIMVDELIYSDMARSFADTGHFLIRGEHADYGPVYPLLLSIPYKLFGPIVDVYRGARIVNVLTMTSVVFPAYLLARRVVRPATALAAAALAVAVPDLVYTGTLMTENAFYPIAIWLALALVAALERPTLLRQVLVLALCALAFLTRAQAVAFVPAVLTAPLLLAWIERGRPRRLAAWKPLYGLVAAAAVVLLAVQFARGASPSALLGGYSVTSSTSYRAWPAITWIVYHVAALSLSIAVVPVAAMIVLVANARHLDRPLRIFAAASVSLVVWLTIEVGVFASSYSFRVEERNLFYVMPLFFVALLAWIERGQPRPPRAAVAAAAVAAALPGMLPFLRLLNITSVSDTVSLQPWWYVGQDAVGLSNVGLMAVAVSLALGACFLWLPRRLAPLLPVLVAVALLATWLPLQLWIYSYPRVAAASYVSGVSAPPSWIDATVGRDADVAVLWSGGNDYRIWINEFWNRSLERVYDLGAPLRGGMPESRVRADGITGVFHDDHGGVIRSRYVLADASVAILGLPLARDKGMGLVLYRASTPVRLASRVRGLYADTWTGPTADWRLLRCGGGSLRLHVRSDPTLFAGVTQRIAISGTTTRRTVSLGASQERTIVLPVHSVGGACSVRLDVSPTRRPADVPALENPDGRMLGIHLDKLTYTPAS
jgi:glycosyltransferase involved in cell wall biosynthesis/4-amino-4-deoxy-L-arabinose transferase-like glycosyltransferase